MYYLSFPGGVSNHCALYIEIYYSKKVFQKKNKKNLNLSERSHCFLILFKYILLWLCYTIVTEYKVYYKRMR